MSRLKENLYHRILTKKTQTYRLFQIMMIPTSESFHRQQVLLQAGSFLLQI